MLRNRKQMRVLATIASAVLASLILVACSSDGGASSTDSTSTDPVEVKVAVSEFEVTSSVTEFKVGVPYRFEVTNTGSIPHELMLIPPMMSSGMSMEEMDAMALNYIEEDDLAAGETRTMEYTFDRSYGEGELELACHITGHYDAGMHLAVQVDE